MMTPEEVAALSDADLSEHVARQVFGLPVYREVRESHPCAVAWPGAGDSVAMLLYPAAETRTGVLLWPSSGDAALHVMEHMRLRWAGMRDGIRREWGMRSVVGGWYVEARAIVTESGYNLIAENASPVPFGRAVFETALLAAQEMASDA